MALTFDWDTAKAESNISKHGVSFLEAASVSSDNLSLTIPDRQHSDYEEHFVLVGRSGRGRLLVVVHTEHNDVIRIISVRVATRRERGTYEDGDVVKEMREEYDFSGGIRGKYAARYAEGTNLVALEPDVAEAFPDGEAVNRALRELMEIARRESHRTPQ